ncbi:MAG TPA: hypothetical protein VJQ82_02615 [Terriglobales bacterium]|nr:hypothetical protein [Terriglobales bacterium]
MKLAIFFLLSIPCLAQTTGQICYQSDKTNASTQVCEDVTPAHKAVLQAYIAAVVNPDSTPVYKGIADLILSYLENNLFPAVLSKVPPAAVQTRLTAIATAEAALATAQAAAAPSHTPAADK